MFCLIYMYRHKWLGALRMITTSRNNMQGDGGKANPSRHTPNLDDSTTGNSETTTNKTVHAGSGVRDVHG